METNDNVLRPKCKRCRNHGMIVVQKGHSKHCPLLHCACWKCQLVTERTRLSVQYRNLNESLKKEEPARAQASPARKLKPATQGEGGARATGGLRGAPGSGSTSSKTSMVLVPHGPRLPAQEPSQAVRQQVPLNVPPPNRPVFGGFGPTAPLPLYYPGFYPGAYTPYQNFMVYLPLMPAGLYNEPIPAAVNQPGVIQFPHPFKPGPSAGGGWIFTSGPRVPIPCSEEPPVQTPHSTTPSKHGKLMKKTKDEEELIVD